MSIPPTTLDNSAPDEPSVGAPSGRIYSGRFPSERATERHGRLVEAGIEVFGTLGYPSAKIKTLCQGAGLSERYFYESFESREHLLTTVYSHLATELMRQTTQALRVPGMALLDSVRAGMASVVNFMLGDPRHAQIILVEIVGISPELEARRHHSLTLFAAESQRLLLLLGGIDLNDAAAAKDMDGHPLAEVLEFSRLTAVSMVGGINNMLLDALHGGTTHNTERITEVSFQLICNASMGIRALAGK